MCCCVCQTGSKQSLMRKQRPARRLRLPVNISWPAVRHVDENIRSEIHVLLTSSLSNQSVWPQTTRRCFIEPPGGSDGNYQRLMRNPKIYSLFIVTKACKYKQAWLLMYICVQKYVRLQFIIQCKYVAFSVWPLGTGKNLLLKLLLKCLYLATWIIMHGLLTNLWMKFSLENKLAMYSPIIHITLFFLHLLFIIVLHSLNVIYYLNNI